MGDKDFLAKLANVPLPRPGFDALTMSAPVLVQMNPQGKWENCAPKSMDEEKIRAVIQHLVNSNAANAAQSYCDKCAAENQRTGGGSKSNYIPVIMMPLYPADQCPFDMDSQIEKLKETDTKKGKKSKKADTEGEKEKAKKKLKKRGFVMQRLNDFDLVSQW